MVKSPFFLKMCVLWERFPVRRVVYGCSSQSQDHPSNCQVEFTQLWKEKSRVTNPLLSGMFISIFFWGCICFCGCWLKHIEIFWNPLVFLLRSVVWRLHMINSSCLFSFCPGKSDCWWTWFTHHCCWCFCRRLNNETCTHDVGFISRLTMNQGRYEST